MSAFSQPPNSLPSSPRANRNMLSPINTNFSSESASSSPSSANYEQHSSTYTDSPPRQMRSRESMIFVNATIPLSPVSITSDDSTRDALLDGLAPRKRSGIARLFCCFGREERARRRVMRATEFEKVGEKAHWSEY